LKQPDVVLTDALRVGKKVIVGFPNFAHLTARLQMFFGGKTPITKSLPYEWHDTPNLHFLTIIDFEEYCKKRNITTEKTFFIKQNKSVNFFPNLIALTAIFQISK
jgi:methionine biosynthesis protein MetW